jgi:hypothetical protein
MPTAEKTRPRSAILPSTPAAICELENSHFAERLLLLTTLLTRDGL